MQFNNWKSNTKAEYIGPLKLNILYFTDDKGNDWYDIWDALTNIDEWVVAVNSDDSISWIDKEIKGYYSPPIGGYIFTIKELPYDITELRNGIWYYKDKKFIKHIEEIQNRTKEDILKDLLELQEELKGLKDK